MKHLMLVAHRVAKAKHALDPTLFAQRRITDSDLHAMFLESRNCRLELNFPLGLPTYVGQTVDLAGMEGEPVPPVIRTKIEGVWIRRRGLPDLETHDLLPVLPPLLHLGCLEAKVSNAYDVHVDVFPLN
jgi:hypothetical protein